MNAIMIEPIKLTELKTAMLLYVPYFASMMLDVLELKVGKFPEIFGGHTPTAATNGKTVWIDQDFLNTLKIGEAVFLLCHEIAHCMWMHMARGKNYQDTGFEGNPFDPSLWNMAGDFVINDMLIASNIGDMPKGGLHDRARFPHTMSADEAYRELYAKPPTGYGGKPADQNGNQGITLDVHILEPAEISEQEMRRAVKTASEAAKARGDMPAALERFVAEFVNPQVPWQEKLRVHVSRNIGRDTKTWRSPNRRRLVMQKLYMPSYTGFGAGTVVVAIDTSGSIGPHELNIFLSELASILDVSKPEKVYVLPIDAVVHEVTELDDGADIVNHPPKLGGGGGTSFKPAFDWIRDNHIEPASLVYFTDMYGDFPNEAPHYPVIWCATTDHGAPWGEIVRIDMSKDRS